MLVIEEMTVVERGQTKERLRERVEKCIFRTIPQLILQDSPMIGYNETEPHLRAHIMKATEP